MFIDGLIFPVPCFRFVRSLCLCVLFILFCFVSPCLFVLITSHLSDGPNPYMPFRTLITWITSQLHLQALLLCTSNSTSLKLHDFIHSFHRLSFHGALLLPARSVILQTSINPQNSAQVLSPPESLLASQLPNCAKCSREEENKTPVLILLCSHSISQKISCY